MENKDVLIDTPKLKLNAIGYTNFYIKVSTYNKSTVTPLDVRPSDALYLKTLLNASSAPAMKPASAFIEQLNTISDIMINEAFAHELSAGEINDTVRLFSSVASSINVFLAITGAYDKIMNKAYKDDELGKYLAMTQTDLDTIHRTLQDIVIDDKQTSMLIDTYEIFSAFEIVNGRLPYEKETAEGDQYLGRVRDQFKTLHKISQVIKCHLDTVTRKK